MSSAHLPESSRTAAPRVWFWSDVLLAALAGVVVGATMGPRGGDIGVFLGGLFVLALGIASLAASLRSTNGVALGRALWHPARPILVASGIALVGLAGQVALSFVPMWSHYGTGPLLSLADIQGSPVGLLGPVAAGLFVMAAIFRNTLMVALACGVLCLHIVARSVSMIAMEVEFYPIATKPDPLFDVCVGLLAAAVALILRTLARYPAPKPSALPVAQQR